jgi:hypothetical protein
VGHAAVVAERKRLAEGGHTQEHAPRDLVECDLIGFFLLLRPEWWCVCGVWRVVVCGRVRSVFVYLRLCFFKVLREEAASRCGPPSEAHHLMQLTPPRSLPALVRQ